MRVRLFVCGVDYGEVEVKDESVASQLLNGQMAEGLASLYRLKVDLEDVARRRCLRCGAALGDELTLCPPCQNEREL